MIQNNTPVVSFDCLSGPREIIDNKYGILVDVGNKQGLFDAIKKLIENKELYNEIKRRSKKKAEVYDLNKIIKKWEKIINRLFATKAIKRGVNYDDKQTSNI